MERYKNILKEFFGKKIVVIGDVMLDEYVMGSVKLLTEDDPRVPILETESTRYLIGGAGNTASNIKSLGGEVTLFGVIGDDYAGEILKEKTLEKGIKFYPSPFSALRTTQKTRFIAGTEHIGNLYYLVRLDREDERPKPVDYPFLNEALNEADIVVISDYAKGVVSKDLVDFLKLSKKRIIVDPKPRNINLYSRVDVIKLNQKEALESTGSMSIYEAGKMLQQKLESKVLITRGSMGMSIFNSGIKDIPTMAREVYDVTGAGDTVLAALSMALASGAEIEDAAIIANHAAGIAVEHVGNYSVSFSELEKRIVEYRGV